MRRLVIVLGLGLTLLSLVYGGCGVNEEGGLAPDSGVGGSGTDGGGVGGGQCFPGAKVCPDSKGELVCLDSNTPETGCKSATACDPCLVPHATAKCSDDGKCQVAKCDDGWRDCNGDPIDGCEVDIKNHPKHCGECGQDCTATGPEWICKNGTCEITDCPVGSNTRDCDGNKANGCEVNVATDPANCLYCGNKCSLPFAQSTCSQSVCVVTLCNPGRDNCDGNDANGCETNTAGDSANCGGCGKKCGGANGVPACQSGQCSIACYQGFANCNGQTSDGCEINVTSDPKNCGSCGKACNPQNVTAPKCTNGACGYESCNDGYADCDGNKANGCEVNLKTDKNHCGDCSTVCSAASGGGALCNNGTCAQTCSPPLTLCSGACVNFSNDVNNCGSCGNKCTTSVQNATPTCVNSACGFNCNSGYAKCGSTTTCYNLSNDPQHCGSCTKECSGVPNGQPTCSPGGNCGFVCDTGYTKCGSACVDLTSDPNHCKACGNKCSAPSGGAPTCHNGSCDFTCTGTLTKCGSQCVDTSSDPNHCGDCGNACSGGKVCQSGSCVCTGSTPDECNGSCTNKQTDKNNCGDCGNACQASQTCNAGKCVGGGSGDGGGTGGGGSDGGG